jgi:hypothetical protein
MYVRVVLGLRERFVLVERLFQRLEVRLQVFSVELLHLFGSCGDSGRDVRVVAGRRDLI